jgi:hypothetical protein
MAEGLLSGVLGDEGDKPEVEAPDALACAEAFASAVAAKLAGNDPEVARETSAFLKMQTQLLEIQAEQLKNEHALRLAHLHHQLGEENIRRFSLRLRVGFQLFVALVATVISVVVAVIIHDVITSHRVVMEPFHPSCAAPIPGSGEQESCVENPMAITFSPWTRSQPGFVGENPAIQWRDYGGTIAFGSVIGGVLGLSFWFFYSHRKKT